MGVEDPPFYVSIVLLLCLFLTHIIFVIDIASFVSSIPVLLSPILRMLNPRKAPEGPQEAPTGPQEGLKKGPGKAPLIIGCATCIFRTSCDNNFCRFCEISLIVANFAKLRRLWRVLQNFPILLNSANLVNSAQTHVTAGPRHSRLHRLLTKTCSGPSEARARPQEGSQAPTGSLAQLVLQRNFGALRNL